MPTRNNLYTTDALNLGAEIIASAIRDLRKPMSGEAFRSAERFLFPRSDAAKFQLQWAVGLVAPTAGERIFANIANLKHERCVKANLQRFAGPPPSVPMKTCQYCNAGHFPNPIVRRNHVNACRARSEGAFGKAANHASKGLTRMVTCPECGDYMRTREFREHIKTVTKRLGWGHRAPCLFCGLQLRSSQMIFHKCEGIVNAEARAADTKRNTPIPRSERPAGVPYELRGDEDRGQIHEVRIAGDGGYPLPQGWEGHLDRGQSSGGQTVGVAEAVSM